MKNTIDKSLQDQILDKFFGLLITKGEFSELSQQFLEQFSTLNDLSRDDLYKQLIDLDDEVQDEN